MGLSQNKIQRHGIIRITIVIAALFVGLIIPLQKTHAEAADVSTAEELQSYFSSGGEIKLVNDITVYDDTYVTADTILDLNGYTLNMSDKSLFAYESSFTIKDNSMAGTGRVTSTNDFTLIVGDAGKTGNLNLDSGTIDCQGSYCIYNYDNLVINGGIVMGETFVIYNTKDFVMNGGFVTSADLTVANYAEGASFIMNGGTVETTSVDYLAISLARPNSSFVMNGGLVSAMQHNEAGDDGGVAIAAFKYTDVTINGGTINAYSNAITGNGSYSGNNEGTNAKFTVNGGTITSETGAGIYAPQVRGVTTITGGTITGATGIEVRAGTLNISGGTITATADYEVQPGINGLSTKGAAISVAQHSTTQPIIVTITGGEFEGEYPISNANPLNQDQAILDQISINVEGGSFSGENLDDVIDNIPSGYTSVDTGGGTTATTIKVVPTNSAGMYLSTKTSGSVNIVGEMNSTAIDYSEVNILSNCHEGYDVVMSTNVSDNSFYPGGDSSSPHSVLPIEDNTPLLATSNRWGYYLSNDISYVPTGEDRFHTMPTSSDSPAVLRTTSSTASASDIDDKFRLYYGANIGSSLAAGVYTLPEDTSGESGSIVYQITASPICTALPVEVFFNQNLDGEGGEDPDAPIYDFPTTSENTLRTDTFNVTTLTLSDKTPLREGYRFVEWNTIPDGTGVAYQPNDILTVGSGPGEISGDFTLYAIWTEGCPTGTICYHGNGADAGTMEDQVSAANAGVALRASNFSRAGYGFAGWNTKPDGSGTNYGPIGNAAVPPVGGLDLFANWIESAGSLQTWTGADSMNIGDITALTDERDGETYAVAKLADGNVWFIENFRLVPSTANITFFNTNHPTAGFIGSAPTSSSSNDLCKTNSVACVDTLAYNTNNLDRSLNQSYNDNNDSSAWYSYGVLYNWYTATAGNGTFDFTNTSGDNHDGTVSGDICPAGWHLPTGNNGEFVNLNTAISGTTTYDVKIRSFANNFIRSGDYSGTSSSGRGVQGRYWSATASEKSKAYRFGHDASSITPNNTWSKWAAFAVRCIYDGDRIPNSKVTINLGEHVNAIKISNDAYGTQRIATSGTTVELANDLSYNISAEFEDSYTIDTWSTTENGQIGDATSINTDYEVTGPATLSLQAVYQEPTCPAGYICYFGNGATSGTMENQAASSSASVKLIPSNYAKVGYGFAGWVTSEDATPYGPNATITTPADLDTTGLKLFAKWVPSAGNLQGWTGCGTLSQGSVTALTDTRDNDTYTVAKLADGNCWITENLRLNPGSADITAFNTNNPTSDFITKSRTATSTNTMCNSNNSGCFDKIQFNSNNTNRILTQSHTNNDNSSAWYTYGTYFNWYTATAGHGTYSSDSSSTIAGDICPAGWHLPTGNTTGEYNNLNDHINGGATNNDNNWRAYPNNFIWSGDYNNNKRTNSYVNTRIWTSTPKDNNSAFRAGLDSNKSPAVTPSSNTYYKWDGFVVRCIYSNQ